MTDDEKDRRRQERRGRPRDEQGLVTEMIQLVDEKHEDAHVRLRKDWRALDLRVDDMERAIMRNENRIEKLVESAAAPVLATKIAFPAPLLTTIIGGFLVLGGGMWSFRADMISRMDAEHAERVSAAKIAEQQNRFVTDRIDSLERKMNLQYAEFQTFRNEITKTISSRR